MGRGTAIQWCHDSVNPGPGCDGCELLPKISTLRRALLEELSILFSNVEKATIAAFLDAFTGDMVATQLAKRRKELLWALAERFGRVRGLDRKVLRIFRKLVKCYAAKMTMVWGSGNKGYPKVFEHPVKFPGRMALAAKWPPILEQPLNEKPWLVRQPRLIFVSDMGDVLSEEFDFDFLKTEIIDTVSAGPGRQHVWLWLTKRPRRMAEFAEWLAERGVLWPTNLVAMSSVTSAGTVKRVAELQRVPAVMRGLSVEPLWEQVKLDLRGIDWVIVGGESGSREAEPFDLAWARDLREQCRASGVAFFVKQLGSNAVEDGKRLMLKDSHGGDWEEWPRDIRIRQMPDFRSLISPAY